LGITLYRLDLNEPRDGSACDGVGHAGALDGRVELPWKNKGAENPKVRVSIKRALCCIEGDITPSPSNSSLFESFKEY